MKISASTIPATANPVPAGAVTAAPVIAIGSPAAAAPEHRHWHIG